MIDLLGTGFTLSSYDWKRDSMRWGVSQYRADYNGRVDLFFAMHKDQAQSVDDEIGLESYPIDDIIEWSGSNYFTSTIAYMIAYALFIGHKEINLFGVEMESDEEYQHQRACIGLTEPAFKYGYDFDLYTITNDILNERVKACNIKAKESTGDQKQQWIGAMYAYSKVMEQIRS